METNLSELQGQAPALRCHAAAFDREQISLSVTQRPVKPCVQNRPNQAAARR